MKLIAMMAAGVEEVIVGMAKSLTRASYDGMYGKQVDSLAMLKCASIAGASKSEI